MSSLRTNATRLLGFLSSFSLGSGHNNRCRCLPQDDCWPTQDTWSELNSTVNGRLLKTIPVGSPCHHPQYDAKGCEDLRSRWLDPELHGLSSSSIMQMYFANRSCDAFTSPLQPCELGNYAAYTVDVKTSEDVAAAITFSRDYNIRFVVRNTGHDAMGRSTGAGALSVWMHSLRSIEILEDYSSSTYIGPAVRIGAGVTGAELAEALHAHRLAAVSGECPSVGAAGGFLQGGGHSTLSSSYGLAADQTLSFEVVTAAGDVVEAAPVQNSDLYWALSGGGGGTYGVVTKVILRAHRVGKIGGGTIAIHANQTSPDTFTKLLIKFHELLPHMVDQGATVVYLVNAESFTISPITAANSTGDFVKDFVAGPFLEAVKEAGITPTTHFTTLSFRDHLDAYLGPLPWGNLATTRFQVGGRMVGRKDVETDSESVGRALSELVHEGVILLGTAGDFNPPHVVDNAVYPQWREAISHISLLTFWDTDPDSWSLMIESQERMSEEFVPRIKEVTPEGGHYVNEADYREPGWKHAFFGSNYCRLLRIKKKWDPDFLFYGLKLVGSDNIRVPTQLHDALNSYRGCN